MSDFPKESERNETVSKETIYRELEPNTKTRQKFVDQIERILWTHSLTPSSIRVAPGREVDEIQVFVLKLKKLPFDQTLLDAIDKIVPYHCLYFLEYEGRRQAQIAEKKCDGARVRVGERFQTDWRPIDEPLCKVDGLDLDAVYENLVLQIAGDKLTKRTNETLATTVERSEKRRKIQRKIETLKRQKRNEPQFKFQLEIQREIKALQAELDALV